MIQFHKLPNLEDLKLLYYDLRDRLKEKYTKPVGGIPASDIAEGVIPDISSKADVSVTDHLQVTKAPVIVESVSGNPIVITDGAAGLPIQSMKLTLLPRQSGSGDASPENVRPLIPWENVGTWTSRANTWNEQWEVGTISIETGENVVANDRIRAKDYNPCVPNKTYFIVDPTHGKNIRLFYYDGEKNFVGDSGWKDSEITTPSNAYFFRFIVAASYGTEYKNDIAINYPSSVTTYAPVTPHPVDLTGITPAVYGCELDLTTGEVWGTKGYALLNDPDKWIAVTGTVDFGYEQEFTRKFYSDSLTGLDCSIAKAIVNQNVTYCRWRGASDKRFGLKNGNSMANPLTLSDIKTMAEAGQIAITYDIEPVLLATLTPQEIETLLGTNTIWSDANGIDIEYRADTGLFVNQNGVKDVQVNGQSVTADGVANVPVATPTTPGVAIVRDSSDGLKVDSANRLIIVSANASMVKGGTSAGRAITPSVQDSSVFYGLAKLAGVDLASSDTPVGTYTDAAKQGIQKMLGLDGLVGPYEADITADRAYAINETFVMDGKRYKATAAIAQGGIITPGTNCELDPLDGRYVRDTDYATSDKAGVAKVLSSFGLQMTNNSEVMAIQMAGSSEIKAASNYYKPIVPASIHQAAFYGLAKVAGVDLASSDTPVGTYTAEAKAAILAMLGAVANDKKAGNGASDLGLVFAHGNNGVGVSEYGGLYISRADTGHVKAGTSTLKPIVPEKQHESVFYALAKLAGADMASLTGETVGVYPQAQKTAIQSMLGIEADIPLVETVTGTTPSITGMPNVRYVCGEVSLLTITPPASGSIVVRFSSGSTATVLTVPNTVKWPGWFDPTDLEANTTYELIITDGVYGGAMAWAD